MKTINNSNLYAELKACYKNEIKAWQVYCQWSESNPFYRIDLSGGLDHVQFRNNGIYFHDRGINGKDNSFIVFPDKNSRKKN